MQLTLFNLGSLRWSMPCTMEGQIISPVTSWYVLFWGIKSSLWRTPSAVCLLLQRSNPLQQSLKKETVSWWSIYWNSLVCICQKTIFSTDCSLFYCTAFPHMISPTTKICVVLIPLDKYNAKANTFWLGNCTLPSINGSSQY